MDKRSKMNKKVSYPKIKKQVPKAPPEFKPDLDIEKSVVQEEYKCVKNEQLNTIQEKATLIEKIVVITSIVIAVLLFPFSLFMIFVVIRQFERVVVLRNGKLMKYGPSGPGLVLYLPCVDSIRILDLRTYAYEVPHQKVLTNDSLTISVNAVVFYKIFDPARAVIGVTNYKVSTHFLAATTLRNALGTRKLAELLTSRPEVSHQVFDLMKHVTRAWGIEVLRVEIKDITLPLQLQKTMAAEAESMNLANAKIIIAKAEIELMKSLQMATEILTDNPMCMQLRYLQSLHMIAGENTHTILFPFSSDVLMKIKHGSMTSIRNRSLSPLILSDTNTEETEKETISN